MSVTIVGNNTPTAGGVVYGDGTNYASTSAGAAGGVLYSAGSSAPAFTAAGTSGQVLTSAGAGAPTWTTPSSGAMTLISTSTASGASSIDFTGLSTSYQYYVLVSKNIVTASDGFSLLMRCSIDNGATFINANSYALNGVYYSNGSLGPATNVNNAFFMALNLRSTLNTSIVTYLMPNPSGSYFVMQTSGQSSYDSGNVYMPGNALVGQFTANTSPVNAVRIYTSGPTFSGTFKLYGVTA